MARVCRRRRILAVLVDRRAELGDALHDEGLAAGEELIQDRR
jgi:hypothetical protein